VGGEAAALYNVSPGSISLVVPAAPRDHVVTVERWGAEPATLEVELAPDRPGLFTLDGRAAVAMHPDGSIVGPDAPAARGELIRVLAPGRGARDPAAPDPEPQPAVWVGGVPAEVKGWERLAEPPGMDQLSFTVPAEAPSGDSLPLDLQVGEFRSNQVLLSVR
jgi:uncharacterized protein (TIGR03437 family)